MKSTFISAKSGNIYNINVIRYIIWSDVYKSFMVYSETGNYVMSRDDFNDIKENFTEVVSTPHLIHYFLNINKVEYVVREMTNFSTPKAYSIKIGEQTDGMFSIITINEKEYQKLIDVMFPPVQADVKELSVVTVKEASSVNNTKEKNTLLKKPKVTKI